MNGREEVIDVSEYVYDYDNKKVVLLAIPRHHRVVRTKVMAYATVVIQSGKVVWNGSDEEKSLLRVVLQEIPEEDREHAACEWDCPPPGPGVPAGRPHPQQQPAPSPGA